MAEKGQKIASEREGKWRWENEKEMRVECRREGRRLIELGVFDLPTVFSSYSIHLIISIHQVTVPWQQFSSLELLFSFRVFELFPNIHLDIPFLLPFRRLFVLYFDSLQMKLRTIRLDLEPQWKRYDEITKEIKSLTCALDPPVAAIALSSNGFTPFVVPLRIST